MQTQDAGKGLFALLSRILPTLQVFRQGYLKTEKSPLSILLNISQK